MRMNAVVITSIFRRKFAHSFQRYPTGSVKPKLGCPSLLTFSCAQPFAINVCTQIRTRCIINLTNMPEFLLEREPLRLHPIHPYIQCRIQCFQHQERLLACMVLVLSVPRMPARFSTHVRRWDKPEFHIRPRNPARIQHTATTEILKILVADKLRNGPGESLCLLHA